jgi:hypothetical protein
VNLPVDLEIRLTPEGELRDVLLDGESRWPIWFKVEWKGNGQVGAKIAGCRISTRDGDTVRFVVGEAGPVAPVEIASSHPTVDPPAGSSTEMIPGRS